MRTEEQVLEDFKKLNYDIIENDYCELRLNNIGCIILIHKYEKNYQSYWENSDIPSIIDIEEHKLLHELFTIWGWL